MESDFIKSIEFTTAKNENEHYHSLTEYVSSTTLKKFKKSPAHWRYQEIKPPTDALIFGSAYHCYILEPEMFDSLYYVFNDDKICQEIAKARPDVKNPRQTGEYRKWKQEYLMKQQGKEALTEVQMDKIKAMKRVLFKHPFARSLFKKGIAEESYYITVTLKDGTEIKVKVRPDYRKPQKRVIVDLKTTIDASTEGFQKQAAKQDYHISGALYKDMLDLIYKENHTLFFVAQEKTPPYAFNIFEASPNFISQGRYEYEMLLLLWHQCQEEGKFPGYQVWCENKYGVNELNLPPWWVKEINFFNHKF